MTAPVGPPRLARWLVEHAVPSDMREDVSGDLAELFHRDSATGGAGRAAARYWRNAVSCSIRLGAVRCRDLLRGGGVPMGSVRGEVKLPLRMFVGWRTDLTLAVRMLFRHPALSAIAVFGITVAIAIAATMFTIVGEQLNPSALPLPGGDRIVALQKWDAANNQPAPILPQDVDAWREQLSTVRDIGAFRTVTRNLIVAFAAPEPVGIAEMSAAGFEVADIPPVMGRVIRPEDERAGAAPVVVIGYAEWHRRFGASPDVLDTTVQLGGTHHTVVGVMPEGFAFPIDHAYWIPLRLDSFSHAFDSGAPLSVFGRLASNATLQSAQSELTAVGTGAGRAWPQAHEELHPRVVPYAHQFSGMDHPGNRVAMQLMRFFVAILLVIVTVNIAALVYARTAARQAEITVRTALGASRGRIVAQLFGEGLVLAAPGAIAGGALAAVALAQVREALSQHESLPFWVRFDLSGETITYIVGLTLLAAAVIGALPGWKATGSRLQNQLQTLTGGGNAGMHLGRVWTALILLQVAFAVALLPMVVVRMLELARDGTQQFGFAAHEYVVAQLSMEGTALEPAGRVERGSRFASRFHEMEQRIASRGTVRASAFSSFAPGFESSALIRSDIGGTDANVRVNRVSVNFFATFRVSLLTGRNFVSADASPEARAVIVNRSFARVVPEGAPVLGSRIRLASGGEDAQAIAGLTDDWYQIVGIVEDFPASTAERPEPKVYRAITPEATEALTVALHLNAADTEPWGTRLRQMAVDVDPALQVAKVTTMDDLLRQHQRSMRLLAAVFAAMTLSVLLLSAAGIYAMMAFSVTQRRREIGIRLALGASARRILWTMFSRATAQLLAGAGLGMGVALLLDRAANGGLASGHATAATAGVVLLMTIAGLLAALGPARQGLSIQPTEALRGPSS